MAHSCSDSALRFLPCGFSLGLYLGLVMVVVKDSLFLLVISRMQVVLWARGSGLPERPVQVLFLMSIRILGTQRRGDGKDCASLLPKERGVRWASLAIFFLALGLGDVLHIRTPGTCLRREQAQGVLPAGRSSRRGQCTGTDPFLIRCIVRAHGQTSARYILSAPPPQPQQPTHHNNQHHHNNQPHHNHPHQHQQQPRPQPQLVNRYCTDPSGQEILYLRALQGHSGRNPIDPTLQDNVLIPDNFFQYICHIGCAINLHSITNSGLIPGGHN